MTPEPDYTIDIDWQPGATIVSCRNRSVTATAQSWASMTDQEIARDLGCLAKEGTRVRDAVALCEATKRAQLSLECWAWSNGPNAGQAAA